MDDVKVYTLDEVASIMRLTKRTLYNYVKSGVLRASKVGKYWRVTVQDLQDFANNGTSGRSAASPSERN